MFSWLHGYQRSQSPQALAVMVADPAGVVGIKRPTKEKVGINKKKNKKNKTVSHRSENKLEIENTFAPAAVSRSSRRKQSDGSSFNSASTRGEWSAPRGWAGVAANCLVPPPFFGGGRLCSTAPRLCSFQIPNVGT